MRAVGIDLGPKSFHLVVLDGTAKRWKVVGVASETLPAPAAGEEGEGALAAAVENAFRRLKAPRDPVVAVVPAAECVFRTIALPFKTDEQIRKVLKFESEAHLHHFTIDEVVVDYVRIGESKGQTVALVVAAPKAVVKKSLRTAEACGFDPQTLDLDATALFNAAVHTGVLPDRGTSLLLHVGARASLLIVAEGRALRHVRAIRAGLETISAGVARDLGLDAASAAKKAGTLEGGEEIVVEFEAAPHGDLEMSPQAVEQGFVAGRREELSTRLAREIVRSTASLTLETPVESVLLCGPGAGLSDLPLRLSTELGRPVSVVNLLEGAETTIPENDVKTAGTVVGAALGAALKAIGLDTTGIELRQEDLRFTRTFDRVKVPLLCALSLLLVALLLQNIYLFRRIGDNLKPSLVALWDHGRSSAKDHAKIDTKRAESVELLRRFAVLKTDVEAKLKSLRERLGHGIDQPMSSLEAWRLVFDRIAEVKDELGRFSLDNLKFDSMEKPARGGEMERWVEVTMTATYYGSQEEVAPHHDRLVAAFAPRVAPWVRDNPVDRGIKKATDGDTWISENMKIEVVVPQEKKEGAP